MDELAGLLAAGERAAFRGSPASGVEPLGRAIELAHIGGHAVEAAAATWLLGVCYSAGGNFGASLEVFATLRPTVVPGVEPHRYASLAAAAAAAVLRQVGDHDQARLLDEEALGLSHGVAGAAFDARLGLSADAIGLSDVEQATQHLEQAAAMAASRPDWWRQRVRRDWVRAELSLLRHDPARAAAEAGAAVALAEQSGAPRHVAKGLLYVGAAAALQGDLAGASAALRRAARLAENVGARPVVWPARALLGRLLAASDAVEAERNIDAAREVVVGLGALVPAEYQRSWLGRPDVSDLLALTVVPAEERVTESS